MDTLVALLHAGNHSLVVRNGNDTRTFDGRGVADLHRLLHSEPSLLGGASVADKVVGKGAAALMILGGVKALHADVVSTPALLLLRDSGIEVAFGREVPYIINRKGDGVCPVEALCSNCNTAAECRPLIDEFINKITQQKH
ncbi:MAG: DUF1893 domain-containing protein [Muribaculaceae bacterium]